MRILMDGLRLGPRCDFRVLRMLLSGFLSAGNSGRPRFPLGNSPKTSAKKSKPDHFAPYN